ncbi:hypothetical protein K470DRAFT_295835 [Piedraia hortae CBS 480.64]|uniref:Plus3 domain-containing protein n=1 Tax=Piedraia hortae CBS 480.64 TaxID=1314780 RepID=A0A6A7BVB3_9PEZI|nr:hypothetical protein K470DRAFT_295835 [Piedraia hortae CBS 480.64]
MADDLDAELLGLVGDDSADEGESDAQSEVQGVEPQEEETVQETIEVAKSTPKLTRGIAQKVKGRAKRGKAKPSIEAELLDLDNGSASPSGSAEPLSERDMSATSPSPDMDEPLYPLEGKYRDAADRKAILGLSEVEREEILAERAQRELKKKQDMQLRRVLAAKASAATSQKRKAADEDSARRTRPKTERGSTALDNYIRVREQKSERKFEKPVQTTRPTPLSSPDRVSEPRSDYGDEPAADFDDFRRCVLPRQSFNQNLFYPKFEETAIGCYVRMVMPPAKDGTAHYRIARIEGFVVDENNKYPFVNERGKRYTSDYHVVVSRGDWKRPWKMSGFSNSRITEKELDSYREEMRKARMRLPSKAFLGEKLQAIHDMRNMPNTNENINYKLRRQEAFERKHDAVYHASVKCKELEERRELAAEDEDWDLYNQLNEELKELQPKAQIATKKSAAMSHQDKMALLNARIRAENAEKVRNALLAEKQKQREARKKAAAAHAAKQKAEAEEAARKANGGVPGDEENKPKAPEAPKTTAKKKKMTEEEFFATYDFGIED